MEPRIQYAKTKDGVSIAFATYGEGQPLVWSQGDLISHVQLEWQQPIYKAFYTAVAAYRMLIRFDGRGSGLSDRDVQDISLEARVRDLEAVTDHLGLTTFALLGLERGGYQAISYAARHPERVTQLVLVNSSPRGADPLETLRGRSIHGLLDDWELLTENLAAAIFGYGREEAKRYAQFIRACTTHETFLRIRKSSISIDLTDTLRRVRAPTLVIRHSGFYLPMEAARDLVAGIPNAQLAVVEGMYLDNLRQLSAAVGEFLEFQEVAQVEIPAPTAAPSGLATILFTDIESSTALTQRLGDAKAQELLRAHNTIVRDALKACGGSEIKHTGDGIMASFPSASGALECAIAIQRAVDARNRGESEAPDPRPPTPDPLSVRIGLNAGEPVAEEQDLFGTAVQLASRICDRAGGGEILASDVVRQLAAGKGFLFSDRGDVELRGFEDPLRLYEVRWRESAGGA